MSIFGFLFFIIVIILVFGLSVISSVLRAIFGFGKRKNTSTGDKSQSTSQTNYGNNKETANNSAKKREKFFDKNEGEYVDFEEIDDADN